MSIFPSFIFFCVQVTFSHQPVFIPQKLPLEVENFINRDLRINLKRENVFEKGKKKLNNCNMSRWGTFLGSAKSQKVLN
jgi:hypothetical protein